MKSESAKDFQKENRSCTQKGLAHHGGDRIDAFLSRPQVVPKKAQRDKHERPLPRSFPGKKKERSESTSYQRVREGAERNPSPTTEGKGNPSLTTEIEGARPAHGHEEAAAQGGTGTRLR